eukprot:gene23248-29452_t
MTEVGIQEGILEYSGLAKRAFAKNGERIVDLSIILLTFGAQLGYILVVGTTLSGLLHSWGCNVVICDNILTTIISVGLFVLPVCLFRHFGHLAWLSLFSVAAIVAVLLLVMIGGPIKHDIEHYDTDYTMFNFSGMLKSTGSIVFSLACASANFQAFVSTEKKSQNMTSWSWVTGMAVFLGAAMCAAMGVAGYLSFGSDTEGLRSELLPHMQHTLLTMFLLVLTTGVVIMLISLGLSSGVAFSLILNITGGIGGPVEPGQRLSIEFCYLTRAELSTDGSFKFVLPTNIAPKYKSSKFTAADVPNNTHMIPRSTNPSYSFKVDIKWSSGSAIQEVVSPTNEIQTSVLTANSIRVQCNSIPANGDFTLCLKTESTIAAYSHESPDDQTTYLYIHNRIPSEVTAAVPRKITILVDRSGSMEGERIEQAVTAIEQFVAQLDETNFINIVGFGDSYEAMWSNHVSANHTNKAKILKMLQTCEADLGGTELLECLTDVVDNHLQFIDTVVECSPDSVGLEHIVMLLTDGEVTDVNTIIEMLDEHETKCRVMTIGIGSDADRKLVQRIAEATNGISRMLVDEMDLTAALADIIDYIHKQYYVNVRVDRYEAVQCSKVLYPAHPLDMFLCLTSEQLSEITSSGLTISAEDPVHKGSKQWVIPIDQCVRSSDLLEKLYANGVICQLEDRIDSLSDSDSDDDDDDEEDSDLVERIVELSVKYGLMNSHASYLIVSDEQTASTAPVVAQSVPHYAPPRTPFNCVARKSSAGMACRMSAPATGGVYRGYSSGGRTKQTARYSSGGCAPRVIHSTKQARMSSPCVISKIVLKRAGVDWSKPPVPKKPKFEPTSVSVSAFDALLQTQLVDGSFHYSDKTARGLLGYPSHSLFISDAATADIQPALFFNMCVLVRLEAQ